MHWSNLALPLLLSVSAASATTATTTTTKLTPTLSNKLYEFAPQRPYADGWAEVSQVLGQTPSKVHSLVAFRLPPAGKDKGKSTCNLRFAKPDIATGSLSLHVYAFAPDNGQATFDARHASWSHKTGQRGQRLATFSATAGRGDTLVHSFPCPAAGSSINYELVPDGDVNMQWPSAGPGGLWLDVVSPSGGSGSASASASGGHKRPVRIDPRDQVQAIEQLGSRSQGSSQSGEVSQSAQPGRARATLVGFVMPPAETADYRGRTCRLVFGHHSGAATGSRTFLLYDFVPAHGAPIFESFLVSWRDRRGFRGHLRATHAVTGSAPKTVLSFPCPGPGTGLNFELAPTREPVNIKWNSREDRGGLWIDVL